MPFQLEKYCPFANQPAVNVHTLCVCGDGLQPPLITPPPPPTLSHMQGCIGSGSAYLRWFDAPSDLWGKHSEALHASFLTELLSNIPHCRMLSAFTFKLLMRICRDTMKTTHPKHDSCVTLYGVFMVIQFSRDQVIDVFQFSRDL